MAQDCTKAVELNPKYVKALFRRAKAHEKLDNKKECLEGEGIFVFTCVQPGNCFYAITHFVSDGKVLCIWGNKLI